MYLVRINVFRVFTSFKCTLIWSTEPKTLHGSSFSSRHFYIVQEKLELWQVRLSQTDSSMDRTWIKNVFDNPLVTKKSVFKQKCDGLQVVLVSCDHKPNLLWFLTVHRTKPTIWWNSDGHSVLFSDILWTRHWIEKVIYKLVHDENKC